MVELLSKVYVGAATGLNGPALVLYARVKVRLFAHLAFELKLICCCCSYLRYFSIFAPTCIIDGRI